MEWSRQWSWYWSSTGKQGWELIEFCSCFSQIIWCMMLWCNFAWRAAAEADFLRREKSSPGNNRWNIYECNLTIESRRLLCGSQITLQHPSPTHLWVWNLGDKKKHDIYWYESLYFQQMGIWVSHISFHRTRCRCDWGWFSQAQLRACSFITPKCYWMDELKRGQTCWKFKQKLIHLH